MKVLRMKSHSLPSIWTINGEYIAGFRSFELRCLRCLLILCCLHIGCVHKVAQSRTERKPTIHKLLPAAHSDPETGVYERPVQPLRTHRAILVASKVRRCKHGKNI